MSAAHVRCMQVLEMPDKEWEYIVLLQVCIYQLFKHKNLIKNICSFQNGDRLNIKADLPFQSAKYRIGALGALPLSQAILPSLIISLKLCVLIYLFRYK